jgi:hypothetical protein
LLIHVELGEQAGEELAGIEGSLVFARPGGFRQLVPEELATVKHPAASHME